MADTVAAGSTAGYAGWGGPCWGGRGYFDGCGGGAWC